MWSLVTSQFRHRKAEKFLLSTLQRRGIHENRKRDSQKLGGSPARESWENENAKAPRINELGIQMLSQPLYEHLFRDKLDSQVYSEADAKRSIEHLRSHNLLRQFKKITLLPDVDVMLPELLSGNLDQHFQNIAKVQSSTYLNFAMKLCRSLIPKKPEKWSEQTGWTRYDPGTGKGKQVSHPMEEALIFDVETCVSDNQRPVLAIALTTDAWYSWVSHRLFSHQARFEEEEASLDDLIPLEPECGANSVSHKSRLVVGHHVSFDRSKIREQYFMGSTETKFLDTLALHMCVSGQANAQRGLWKKSKKKSSTKTDSDSEDGAVASESVRPAWMAKKKKKSHQDSFHQNWMEVSSPNNLADVHSLYSKNSRIKLNKDLRDVFVQGSLKDVRESFQELVSYCAADVQATKEILEKVFPMFLERCPHPVTFAGMLEMGMPYLPLNSSWKEYVDSSEHYYESIIRKMKAGLMEIAKDACQLMKNERYLECPWLCNLDWGSIRERKFMMTKREVKERMDKLERYFEMEEKGEVEDLPHSSRFIICDRNKKSKSFHMPGYPNWYRSLCKSKTDKNYSYGPVKISASMKVTPYLLQMKWKGYPLHHHGKLGWGYIIDPATDTVAINEKGILSSNDMDESLEEISALLDTKEYWDFPVSAKATAKKRPVPAVKQPAKQAKKSAVPSAEWTELGSEWPNPLQEMEDGVGEEAEAEVEAPESQEFQMVATKWGITDDIVNLPNRKTYYYFKLPHKFGKEKNVGNPLSKDFLGKLESGILSSSAGKLGKNTLVFNSMISFWRGSRSRILDQFVVGTDEHTNGFSSSSGGSGGDLDTRYVVIPCLYSAGTITRRAVDPTWLTASNAKESRVGSELKTLVRAPPGYHLVGADVDSQELWIASLLGDKLFTKIHGSTAISWMVSQGDKNEGTDVHSMTAKTVGVSRDDAKVLNYARIYGAGRKFMETLLRMFNSSFSDREVQAKGKAILLATKGRKGFCLNEKGEMLAKDMGFSVDCNKILSDEDWSLMISVVGYYRALDMVEKTQWVDGTESYLFNMIEAIAKSEETKTPILGCCITRALEAKRVGEVAFFTSRVNWVVQSSAVDYLHLLLVCMRWLMDYFGIEGRYCLSIHDEVRYLVKSKDRYRAALALQYANLFTRAMFSYKLGMYDLPQSTAFFSGVDVDKVFRKDPLNDCVTPSNPEGLVKGHGIPLGEVLDIYDLIKLTNGSLDPAPTSALS